MDPNSKVLFLSVCELCEKITQARTVPDKRAILEQYISDYNKNNPPVTKNDSGHFHQILRLLLPNLDKDRGAYRLKDHSFTKVIVNILGLNPKGEDANLLNKYNSSHNKKIQHYSDAAFVVLQKRFSTLSSTLTITDINSYLDQLAAADVRSQENVLLTIFRKLSSLEQKWFIRIILKELHLGIGTNNILKSFHKDAVTFLDHNSSLSALCKELHDPSITIQDIEISLLHAFRPMLSRRCDAKQLKCVIDGIKPFYLENKFDGERFQMHKSGNAFKYFSRNGFDYSSHYGESFNSGTFTKKLKNAFKTDVKSVILDGEMMLWNVKEDKFGSKGLNADVKKLISTNVHQPCFCVFDIIYLNGKNLAGMPLEDRKSILQKLITPIRGVIEVSTYTEAKTQQDIIDALNFAMDMKEEGIVFKDPLSIYSPNNRTGWWKVKHEFFEHVMSDLDVLIIGGFYGENKDRRNVKVFLVGIIDKSKDEPTYLSLAKLNTGLNREEWTSLYNKLNSFWKPTDSRIKEHESYNVFWGKEVPDVWIKPEDSCCLTVRGSELIRLYGSNPDYKTKYTLRFPRIQTIRFDKTHLDCLTTEELDALTESAAVVQKLSKRHLDLSDLEQQQVKRPRNTSFLRATVEASNDILEGFEFLVLTGTDSWSKEDVEKAIEENGGKVVKSENSETLCMIAGHYHLRFTSYHGDVDIVKIGWLRSVLNEGEFSLYKLQDMIYTSPKTKKRFLKLNDKFGDSYLEPITVMELKSIVNMYIEKFEKDNFINLMALEVKEFNNEINFEIEKKFLGICAYFDKYKIINDVDSQKISSDFLEEIDFIAQGGTVCKFLTKDCDYVVTKLEERRGEINLYLASTNNDICEVVNSTKSIDT